MKYTVKIEHEVEPSEDRYNKTTTDFQMDFNCDEPLLSKLIGEFVKIIISENQQG